MDKEIREIFARAGFAPDWNLLERLRAAVVDANTRMNLTRLTEPRDFYLKHVLDSVLPFLVVPRLRKLTRRRLQAADLGSGAGFPGFALAHAFPAWKVALIERTQKKAAFLDATITELGLANLAVVPHDAREAASHVPALRRGCDLVVARAVGRISAVQAAAAPLLKPRALLVHYKGADPDGPGETHRYDLPPDSKRSIVISRG